MRKRYWLKKWSRKLGITDKITFEYIPRSQIYCLYKVPVRLVGICNNCIIHDRRLTEEDIVHELLHHLHPRYKESTIRRKTKEVMNG